MPTDTVQDRAKDLTESYLQKLDAFVNDLVPPVLDNAEYAARCSALLIALNRQLEYLAHLIEEAEGLHTP